mmetsp:Transcript_13277/g.1939  ORF Transcript_13277/g.1939 Transcript_13277/m.1939 type:complete len:118 (+) Transcript_13277:126-479(+)
MLSIICILFSTIPLLIPSSLIKSKNKCICFFAIALIIAYQIIALYTSLATAAVMGVEESNKWVISYIFSFCADSFMIDPLKNCFKISYLRNALISGKKTFLVKLLVDKSIIKYLKSS